MFLLRMFCFLKVLFSLLIGSLSFMLKVPLRNLVAWVVCSCLEGITKADEKPWATGWGLSAVALTVAHDLTQLCHWESRGLRL